MKGEDEPYLTKTTGFPSTGLWKFYVWGFVGALALKPGEQIMRMSIDWKNYDFFH